MPFCRPGGFLYFLSGHPKPANRERAQDIENDGGITSVIVSNVLAEEKKQQVLTLGRLGWSLRRIEKQAGIRRETAGAYLKAAGIALRPPGAWGKRAPPKPANAATTDPAPSNSACEPYRDLVEQALMAGRNAVSIWRERGDRHRFTGAYETVKRFVRKQRGAQTPEARAVILTASGEELQVDYGTGPQVRDPKTGKYRRTRLFVLIRTSQQAADVEPGGGRLGKAAGRHGGGGGNAGPVAASRTCAEVRAEKLANEDGGDDGVALWK